MIIKRKRAPGGGRKPRAGEAAERTITIRVTEAEAELIEKRALLTRRCRSTYAACCSDRGLKT